MDDWTDDPFLDLFKDWRKTDPDTSKLAALRNQAQRGQDRWLALKVFYLSWGNSPLGLTDFELADFMGRQQTSAGKRRGELRDLGLVEATDQRRPAPSGSPAIVWRITELGRKLVEEQR